MNSATQHQSEIDNDPELIAVLVKLQTAKADLAVATRTGDHKGKIEARVRVRNYTAYATELGWVPEKKPTTPRLRINMRG
jgi:hypothetical protein